MLDAEAVTESRCIHCDRESQVTIKDNALADFAPPETRVSYMEADACCVAALEQCPSINFFCSAEHFEAWHADHQNTQGMLLTLDEAFAQGVRVFGSLFK